RAKEPIALDRLAERLPALLEEIQQAMFRAALEFRDANTTPLSTVDEVEAHFAARRGFVALPWQAGDAALEARIKEKTGATLRCIPLDQERFAAHGAGRQVALFARAY